MLSFVAAVSWDTYATDRRRVEKLAELLNKVESAQLNIADFGNLAVCINPQFNGDENNLQNQCYLQGNRHWVVFFGQIFNLDSLCEAVYSGPKNQWNKDKLAQIILSGYLKYGNEWFGKIYGNFICVIYDKITQRLILCRDPVGNHALYYRATPSTFYFSTDQATIINASAFSNDIPYQIAVNKKQIAAYFSNQSKNPADTYFKGINAVPPGHVVEAKSNNINVRRFWAFPKKIIRAGNVDIIHQFKEKLTNAVMHSIAGQQTVPVLLSGGMDSTSITALAHQLKDKKKLLAISHVFDRFSECDERVFLDAFYKKLNLEHLHINADDCLPLSHDPTQLHRTISQIWVTPMIWQRRKSYSVMQEIGARGFMTGEYGDHLFGAYRYWLRDLLYAGHSFKTVMAAFKHIFTHKDMLCHRAAVLRRIFPLNGIMSSVRHPVSPWLTDKTKTQLKEHRITKGIVNVELEKDRYSNYFGGASHDLSIQLYEEAEFYGLKPWVPFRDRELAEYTLNLPAYFFYDFEKNWHKHILREAMQGILPDIIRERRQATVYNTIMRESLFQEHNDIVQDILRSDSCGWHEYIRKSYVLPILNKKHCSDQDMLLIWSILCFEMWRIKANDLLEYPTNL